MSRIDETIFHCRDCAPQEKDAFWRTYENYESGLDMIKTKRIFLATTFLSDHNTLSHADALDMLEKNLSIDREELEYKHSFVEKFIQVLPGKKVVRLYQTENRFDTAASFELYRNIPIIR